MTEYAGFTDSLDFVRPHPVAHLRSQNQWHENPQTGERCYVMPGPEQKTDIWTGNTQWVCRACHRVIWQASRL